MSEVYFTALSQPRIRQSLRRVSAAFIGALQDGGRKKPGMTDSALLHDWLRLVRAEYEELPDLRLTQAEVERLWGLDPPTAIAILATLVSAGVLRKTSRGAYVRSDAG